MSTEKLLADSFNNLVRILSKVDNENVDYYQKELAITRQGIYLKGTYTYRGIDYQFFINVITNVITLETSDIPGLLMLPVERIAFIRLYKLLG